MGGLHRLGVVWTGWDRFGLIWTDLGLFGPVWIDLNRFWCDSDWFRRKPKQLNSNRSRRELSNGGIEIFVR